jgi:hypothetical protein
MTQDEFFKIIGIIIVCFFIIYMTMKMFQLQTNVIEGLTNADGTVTQSSTLPSSGEAGFASSYAAAIKSQVVKLQDELLISKYRKDYEAAIINLDDYIGYLMIRQTLNMNLKGDMASNIKAIEQLNTLRMSKESLNATMTFLDKQ